MRNEFQTVHDFAITIIYSHLANTYLYPFIEKKAELMVLECLTADLTTNIYL